MFLSPNLVYSNSIALGGVLLCRTSRRQRDSRTTPSATGRVTVYGYLRGSNLKPGTQAHLAGVGDMMVSHAPSQQACWAFTPLLTRAMHAFWRAMQYCMAAQRLTHAAC